MSPLSLLSPPSSSLLYLLLSSSLCAWMTRTHVMTRIREADQLMVDVLDARAHHKRRDGRDRGVGVDNLLHRGAPELEAQGQHTARLCGNVLKRTFF